MAQGRNTELITQIASMVIDAAAGIPVSDVLRQIIFTVKEQNGITVEQEGELLGIVATDPALVGMKGKIKEKEKP